MRDTHGFENLFSAADDGKEGLGIKDLSGFAYHAHDESLVILLPSGPRRTVRTDDRGRNGASGCFPRPRSDRPVLVMTTPLGNRIPQPMGPAV